MRPNMTKRKFAIIWGEELQKNIKKYHIFGFLKDINVHAREGYSTTNETSSNNKLDCWSNPCISCNNSMGLQARRQKFSEGGSFDTAGGLGAAQGSHKP